MEEYDDCVECGLQISSEFQNLHPGVSLCRSCYEEMNIDNYEELDESECNAM